MKQRLLLAVVVIAFTFTPGYSQLFDTSFDTIGYTHTNPFDGNVKSMVFQPDGKIVSAYDRFFVQPTQNMFMKVARTRPDGLADTTFGSQGVASIWLGEAAASQDVALQSDGKILIGGQADYCVQVVCGYPNLGVARFNSDGTVDSTFGGDGLVKSEDVFNPVTIMGASATSITCLLSGKILISGFCWTTQPTFGTVYVYVARLNSDGTLDNTFANNGVYYTSPTAWNRFGDMELDANGNIVVTGEMWTGSVYVGFLLRLLPNGTPDNSFGPGGIKQFYYPGTNVYAKKLEIRSDGKFVVSGYLRDSISGAHRGYISLLETNGTFSNEIPGGTLFFNFAGWDNTEIRGIKVLQDHHILFCGILDSSASYNTVGIVGRLNNDGTYDTTFNSGNGYALYQLGPFSTFGSGTFMNTIEQQSDGKILVGGGRNTQAQSAWQAFTMMRLIPDSIMTVIPQLQGEDKFSLFPTVNEGSFTIELNNIENYTLEIIDVMGKVVHSEMMGGNSVHHIQFNGAPGMYYARVSGREYSGVRSFVVN